MAKCPSIQRFRNYFRFHKIAPSNYLLSAIIDKSIPDTKDNSSWIVLNLQQGGYYRVNYDQTIWNNLVKQLTSNHEV